ncbi:filamentous hemagglutinin N-terminal domain-containing protein [Oscillatoria sp. FACHB-1406]|uniref:two-partner secretion domain-containing protein n=1 Tax=Oscillatoria sp. FACHB-1406 TaxID=2692846 RepID=UPI0016839D00|nr:filamentous hemagglutinin N-terminal domain-containing protein [Oscillatoria sp. FACHB-1406]MBD2578363.1 filamentous hemagglutinin N-terminal domain-containing protein [Oscillatoria sp. FACHB-1406]
MKRGNLHLLALLLLLHPFSTNRATAQLTPDNTLGAENSIVTPEATRQLIQGGTTRGSNLFHSFTDFNVGENQRVYFANPTDITNILTRVTGNNLSNILGTLGVDGAANLFLLNPNGIIFGPNAQLDIRGSFVATTADSILFDNNVAFSASDPQAPPLLTINVPIGLQYGSNSTATISDRGSLSAGGNLKLGAANLDLQGQLQAGGDLTLQATDTITIRDSETSPFIAAANGQLLVQGNEKVDIFALNHPDSGLYSGGDMVFRSANAVGGDAHYQSGGNFRIEDLQGKLGGLYSPYDPIILTKEDVYISDYVGSSLHILAGGRVKIGNVTITEADPSSFTIYPGHPDPEISKLASVSLPDGTTQIIDGRNRPTLDIRAGINHLTINDISNSTINPKLDRAFNADSNVTPPPDPSGVGNLDQRFTPEIPVDKRSYVEIGSIQVMDKNGLVFISNNSRLAPVLPNNNIQINGTITTQGDKNSDIIIDSRDRIIFTGDGTQLNTGNIKLFSTGGIRAFNDVSFVASGSATLNGNLDTSSQVSKGRNVQIDTGESLTINGNLNTSSKAGSAGSINLESDRNVILSGNLYARSSQSYGGDIKIEANNDIFINSDNKSIDSSSSASNAGAIDIFSRLGNITIDNSQLSAEGFTTASGNTITLTAELGKIDLLNGSRISASTYGIGNAGKVSLTALETIGIDNSQVLSSSLSSSSGQAGDIEINVTAGTLTLRNEAGIYTSTESSGDAGNISIYSRQFNLEERARLSANTNHDGNAGKINIHSSESVNLDRGFVFVNSFDNGLGNAGQLTINTENLTVKQGSIISAASDSLGLGGDIHLNVPNGTVNFVGNDFISLSPTNEITPTALAVGSFGNGAAGSLTVDAKNFIVQNGALIYGSANRASGGNAANITIAASESVQILGTTPNGQLPSSLSSDTFGAGNAGNLIISTPNLLVRDGGRISAGTTGTGSAGTLNITGANLVEVTGTSLDAQRSSQLLFNSFGSGNAGELKIETRQLLLQNGGRIIGTTGGSGQGGIIDVNATESISISGTSGNFASGLIFDSNGSGNARGIRLQTAGDLAVKNGGQITVSGTGAGVSGDLDIAARNIFLTNQGQLSASTRAAQGGNIRLQASKNLILRHNSEITAEAFGASTGGNIHMDVGGVISAVLSENSDIVASSESGQGGKIYSDAPALGFRQYNGRRTPESDFTAISEQGGPDLSGTVVVTRNVPPLVELPNRFAPPPLNEGCDGGQTKENSRSGRAALYIPGRGGLPPQPTDMLGSTTVEIPWLMSEENEPTASSPELVEATGWEKLPNGRIRLTAPDSEKLGNLPLACRSREEESKNR